MAQVSRVAREKATLILVTKGIAPDQVRRIGFACAATPQGALDMAFERVGGDAQVAVLRGAAEMLPCVGTLP